MCGEDADDPLSEAARRHDSGCWQRAKGRQTKSRERGEAGRVCPGGAGCRNRHFVAGHFALEIQLAAEPPHRGMPPGNHPNEPLHELHHIVAALHVSPFVDDDAIEIGVTKVCEKCRCDGNDR